MSKTKSNLDAKLLAEALAYSDEEIRNKWLKAAEEICPSFAFNLKICLKKTKPVSKLHSDRRKAYLANNFASIEDGKWGSGTKRELMSYIARH
jgi:hypothetical protein